MAKAYEFELQAIRARLIPPSSPGGFVGVSIDCRDFYRENALALIPFSGTLAEAIAERARQAKLLNKGASWMIQLKDRNAKKPVGFKAVRELHYFPEDQGAA